MKTYGELRTDARIAAIVLYTKQTENTPESAQDYIDIENQLKELGPCFNDDGSINTSWKGVF